MTKEVQLRIWGYLSEVLHTMGCSEITVRGVDDHVHGLCNLGKHHAPKVLMQRLKGDSSQWIKTLDPSLAEFCWQAGYGMFGVDPNDRDVVLQYILNQEEHHKQETFKEEYLRLLREHNVEVDERYLWD
jgi:REP element-mobilizing transposase RayT